MSLGRLVYKTHRWLAVGAGLFTFIWFASGIVMILPSPLWKPGGNSKAGNPDPPAALSFREVTVTPREVIEAVGAIVPHLVEVSGMRFRQLPDHLVYEISTVGGISYLIDATNGQQVVITEDFALQIVASKLGSRPRVRGVSLLREHGLAYKFGSQPVYRFALEDSEGTVVYVGAETGDTHSMNRLGRIRAFIVGTHSFDFLRPFLPRWSVRLALLAFGTVGLLMSVLGGWILWLQFKNWRRGTRRTI